MNVRWSGAPVPGVERVGLPVEDEAETRRVEIRERIMPKFDEVVAAFRADGSTAAHIKLLSLGEFDFPEVTERYGAGKRHIAGAVIGRVLTDLGDLVQLLVIAGGIFNPALQLILSGIASGGSISDARTEFADEMTRELSTTPVSIVAKRRGQGPTFEVFASVVFNMLRPPVDVIVSLIANSDGAEEMQFSTLAQLERDRLAFTRSAIEFAVASTAPNPPGSNPVKATVARKKATRRAKTFAGVHLRSLISLYLRVADSAAAEK